MIDSDLDGDFDFDMGLQGVCLHTNASADQLWERWQLLCDRLEQAGNDMTAAADRWKQATDPVARKQLWAVYEAAAREYRVLASWKDLHHAAYIFCTDGADCAALNVSSHAS